MQPRMKMYSGMDVPIIVTVCHSVFGSVGGAADGEVSLAWEG